MDGLERSWDALGESDAMWAILYDPDRKGNRWDPEQFYATGRERIADVLALLDELGIDVERGRALDFGCGLGRLSQPLAASFDRVDGVDVAASMVRGATAALPAGSNCHFHHNTVPDLALFDDATFDFVFTEIVLQHIPADLALGYISEFVRVLAPGGIAIFDVPSGYARSVRGQLVRFAPDALLNRYRARTHGDGVMELHVTPPSEVRAHLSRLPVRIRHEQDLAAEDLAVIVSRQYVVERI
jgi:SAM-dependent methyltransferase